MFCNYDSTAALDKKASRRLAIGVIKSNMSDQRDILFVEGLKDAADENGVNLIVYRGGMIVSPEDIDLQAISIFDFVDKNRLDGLIIWTGNICWHASEEFTEMFVKKYNFLPVISLENKIEGITSILWDNYNGMREALKHLIEVHKYKRIGAFVDNAPSSLYQRHKAYTETLTEYGIPIDPNIVINHNELYDFENTFQYAINMERSIFVEQGIKNNFKKSISIIEKLYETGIDALVCCNDLSARTVIRILKARNLPLIPIVGFDDDPESRANNPSLTTVRPPVYEMGKRAVEVIIAKIKGHNTLETEYIPCELIVRQSCGCPGSLFMKEDLYKEKSNQYISFQGLDNINADKFEEFLNCYVSAPNDIDPNWSKELLKAFWDDIQGNEGVFAEYLRKLLLCAQSKKNIEFFQDIIIVMHSFIDSLIKNNTFDYYKAKKLLQQGTVLAADIRIRLEMSKRLKQTQRHYDIITFSHMLANTYDMDEIMERTVNGLRYLGVSSCYLSLYENGKTSTEIARLLMAYSENKNIEISKAACTYPSKLLLPEELLPIDERFHYVLKPLHFRKRNIGFVLFADTLRDYTEYERLTEIISNVIHSSILVDELKSKTQELTKTNSELESAYRLLKENQQKLLISEKMASLGRLTAGIAHEINTPLASVRTSLKELSDFIHEYNESIGNPSVLPEDHRLIKEDMIRCLKLATQSAEKSAGFIKAINSQTTNASASNFQLFNVAQVIKEALTVLEFAIRKGNCRLITNFDNSINLYGDPNKLAQVATNLVINSIDACEPDGGTITILIENNGYGFAKLTFQDTGCGIPEEVKSRIFDPMFTTKPFGEGTGLGLSIVHDLINEFKGSINIESQKGLTSFYIFLPTKP